MADTEDLKSSELKTHEGSNPSPGTIFCDYCQMNPAAITVSLLGGDTTWYFCTVKCLKETFPYKFNK